MRAESGGGSSGFMATTVMMMTMTIDDWLAAERTNERTNLTATDVCISQWRDRKTY